MWIIATKLQRYFFIGFEREMNNIYIIYFYFFLFLHIIYLEIFTYSKTEDSISKKSQNNISRGRIFSWQVFIDSAKIPFQYYKP